MTLTERLPTEYTPPPDRRTAIVLWTQAIDYLAQAQAKAESTTNPVPESVTPVDQPETTPVEVTKPADVIETRNIFELYKPPFFERTARKLVEYHRAVAAKHGVDTTAYFNFTKPKDESEPMLATNTYKGLELKGGRIAAFTPTEIASVIHEQMRTYVTRDTMGNFPVDDPEALEQLVAIMISGYDAETLISTATKRDINTFPNPIASVRATVGKGEGTVADNIGNENCNLPTLAALKIPLELLPPELAATPLEQTVCIGRFAVTVDMGKLNPEAYKGIALETLCNMRGVFSAINETREKPLTQIVYDTHNGVAAMSKRYFGGTVVAGPDDLTADGKHAVQATKVTSESVLKHHYEYLGATIYFMTTTIQKFIHTSKV